VGAAIIPDGGVETTTGPPSSVGHLLAELFRQATPHDARNR
jgi:hypothetical protein